jgi:hypothetical protein
VSSAKRSGVLFDVLGMLVDSNYLHTLAWSRADAGAWAPRVAYVKSDPPSTLMLAPVM